MKNVIITGATGMVGNIVLKECLKRDDVSKVTSISRKPLGITHDKLVEVIHKDFMDYTNVEKFFNNQDICFFCIGVYTGAVSNDLFNKITIDFTQVFAEKLKKHSDINNKAITFCFLSGQGADEKEKSRVLFAKAKGIAENILKKIGFSRLHIFRPGYIYPTTPRKEPNAMYRFMRVLYKPVSFIYPNIGLTSSQLANAMVKVAFDKNQQVVFENRDIKRV